MTLQQQILTNSSSLMTVIPNDTKNPMTESKKFCMKGLKDPQELKRKEGILQDHSSVHDLKTLDRRYTPKKIKVINTDITTKSKYGVSPSLVCCKFLIKFYFSFFLFTHNKNLEK